MKNEQLAETLADFKDFKGIDRTTSASIIESTFKSLIKKKYGDDSNFDIIVNEMRGDFEIWQTKEIVHDGEVEYPNKQICITDARKVEPDFEIGEDFVCAVSLSEFDRRSILNARQLINTKVIEHQKQDVIERYKSLVGDIINGEVYQIWKNEIMVLDDQGTELILPKDQTIPGEFFRKGESVRVIVDNVELYNSNVRIIVSRTSNLFLTRLLEEEVPQITDGQINIIKVVRQPGTRAKVVVESIDDRIDAVGSIVGVRGSRIRNINQELRGESIDIINFSSNEKLMISRCLSPAKIEDIEFEDGNVYVYVNTDQIALAVGKHRGNISLASKIIDKNIEIYTDEDDTDEE